MREAQNMNFSVGSMNQDESKGKPSRKITMPDSNNLNFEEIVKFIKSKKYPKTTEDNLIKIAKNMPHGSYNNFKNNYKNYLK